MYCGVIPITIHTSIIKWDMHEYWWIWSVGWFFCFSSSILFYPISRRAYHPTLYPDIARSIGCNLYVQFYSLSTLSHLHVSLQNWRLAHFDYQMESLRSTFWISDVRFVQEAVFIPSLPAWIDISFNATTELPSAISIGIDLSFQRRLLFTQKRVLIKEGERRPITQWNLFRKRRKCH